MDLWLPFSNRWLKLQKKFETLLQADLDSTDPEILKKKKSFEVSQDETLIRGISAELPPDDYDRALVLFSRLSPFFEIGVFVSHEDNNGHSPQSFPLFSFLYGQFRSLRKNRPLELPRQGPGKVFRSENQQVWKNIEIFPWIENEALTSFVIQIDPAHSFILFSKLADPWLKLHWEKIHQEILKT